MDVNEFIAAPDGEKPLDRLVTDGGFCGIFRTIGCIGDSLSSGEFESLNEKGEKGYHDHFEYSWGQYIARSAGCTVRNFSRGGMSASEYWNTFAEANGFWSSELLCQAYIIALGANDLSWLNQPLGSAADIDLADCGKNAETFAGYYGRIIQRLKSMQPKAKFFLVTMPRSDGGDEPVHEAHAELMHSLASIFDNTYVLDLHAYAPVYDAAFRRSFYLGGHLSPAGYLLTARMIESCIDYLVRHNPRDFAEVGFIGTDLSNKTY